MSKPSDAMQGKTLPIPFPLSILLPFMFWALLSCFGPGKVRGICWTLGSVSWSSSGFPWFLVSMPFLRLFSSPETGENLREISGDRNGDQI